VPYIVDSEETNAALSASATGPGDTRPYYNAVLDEVNRSGGVAGRKLVPSYFAVSAANPQSADEQTSAACEHWTHDVKTFVVFDALNELIRDCAERHGMLALNGGPGGVDTVTSTFRRYPHYLEPSSTRLDALAAMTVEGLARTDYFDPGAVIGVVTWDSPNFRTAVSHGLQPALHALGLKTAVEEYVAVPETTGALSSSSASISSAILAFRQRGVTHAFVLDGPSGVALGSVLTILWMNAAGSQKYYPRYGFNDYNNAGSAYGVDNVRRSRVISTIDTDADFDAGVGTNRRREECFAVMRRHGLSPTQQIEAYMVHACDNVWYFRAVLGTARTVVDRDRVMAVAAALGTTYRSPYTYRTRFSSDQRDGVAAFRRMGFYDDCTCFRYISGLVPRGSFRP